MASLEQRINYLFPDKTRNESAPIAMVALIFAERRGQWLTHCDLINLINKRCADSTVLKAFKILSRPLDVLDGCSFIDTESVKRGGRGGPIVRGKLSKAASEKIFASVPPVKQKPISYFYGLNGKGRLEIPPLQLGDEYLPSDDIIRLRIHKSGEKETRRLLNKMVNDTPGKEKEAMQKMIDKLAEKQGVTFNATNGQFTEDGKMIMPTGKLAEAYAKWRCLHDKDSPYAKTASNFEILKKHHLGRFPEHQKIITDIGLRELASDVNRTVYQMDILIVDSREDRALV